MRPQPFDYAYARLMWVGLNHISDLSCADVLQNLKNQSCYDHTPSMDAAKKMEMIQRIVML